MLSNFNSYFVMLLCVKHILHCISFQVPLQYIPAALYCSTLLHFMTHHIALYSYSISVFFLVDFKVDTKKLHCIYCTSSCDILHCVSFHFIAFQIQDIAHHMHFIVHCIMITWFVTYNEVKCDEMHCEVREVDWTFLWNEVHYIVNHTT